jgi:MoaA/NifB/PqqE/SkfB family radical SAM enzyme
MSEAVFRSLMDEMGEYLFYVLFYKWGEPLMNKSLPEFVRIAKSYDIHTEINSNLSFRMTDEDIANLLCSGIDHIAASIDGFSQKSYESYRRGGSFELARGNVERLVAARDSLGLSTQITWNFLIFSFNEDEVEAARQYCKDRGIVFNPHDAFINVARMPDWLPSHRKSELNPMTRQAGAPTWNYATPTTCSTTCSWHYCISVVNADGSVSPCCAPWEQRYDFGTVLPGVTSFADIWNNDFYRKSRAVLVSKDVEELAAVEPLCAKCPYNDAIKNQYTWLDTYIGARFRQVFGNADPVLTKAFELLNNEHAFMEYYSSLGQILAGTREQRKEIEAGRPVSG